MRITLPIICVLTLLCLPLLVSAESLLKTPPDLRGNAGSGSDLIIVDEAGYEDVHGGDHMARIKHDLEGEDAKHHAGDHFDDTPNDFLSQIPLSPEPNAPIASASVEGSSHTPELQFDTISSTDDVLACYDHCTQDGSLQSECFVGCVAPKPRDDGYDFTLDYSVVDIDCFRSCRNHETSFNVCAEACEQR